MWAGPKKTAETNSRQKGHLGPHCSDGWLIFRNTLLPEQCLATKADNTENKCHTFLGFPFKLVVKQEKWLLFDPQMWWDVTLVEVCLSLSLTMMDGLNLGLLFIYVFHCLYSSSTFTISPAPCLFFWCIYSISLMLTEAWRCAEWGVRQLQSNCTAHSQRVGAELRLQEPPPLQEKHGDVKGVHVRVWGGSTGHQFP